MANNWDIYIYLSEATSPPGSHPFQELIILIQRCIGDVFEQCLEHCHTSMPSWHVEGKHCKMSTARHSSSVAPPFKGREGAQRDQKQCVIPCPPGFNCQWKSLVHCASKFLFRGYVSTWLPSFPGTHHFDPTMHRWCFRAMPWALPYINAFLACRGETLQNVNRAPLFKCCTSHLSSHSAEYELNSKHIKDYLFKPSKWSLCHFGVGKRFHPCLLQLLLQGPHMRNDWSPSAPTSLIRSRNTSAGAQYSHFAFPYVLSCTAVRQPSAKQADISNGHSTSRQLTGTRAPERMSGQFQLFSGQEKTEFLHPSQNRRVWHCENQSRIILNAQGSRKPNHPCKNCPIANNNFLFHASLSLP